MYANLENIAKYSQLLNLGGSLLGYQLQGLPWLSSG